MVGEKIYHALPKSGLMKIQNKREEGQSNLNGSILGTSQFQLSRKF
jgi:hypothetical protein